MVYSKNYQDKIISITVFLNPYRFTGASTGIHEHDAEPALSAEIPFGVAQNALMDATLLRFLKALSLLMFCPTEHTVQNTFSSSIISSMIVALDSVSTQTIVAYRRSGEKSARSRLLILRPSRASFSNRFW